MIFKILNHLCIYGLFMCLTSFSSTAPRSHLTKVRMQIGDAYTKHLKKTKNFELFGLHGSFVTEEQSIGLSYISHEKVDIAKARIFLVDAVEGLIKIINEDEKIRPFLHSYPFTNKNVEISIGFQDKDDQFYSDGHVAMISNANGKVFYSVDVCKNGPLKDLHKEAYEEALKIVKETHLEKNYNDF